MSQKKFTQDEVIILKNNKYTYSVTENSIKFTMQFKQLLYDKIQQGILPSKILEECGYDIKILGPNRPSAIARHIVEEYKVHGAFHSGKKRTSLEAEVLNGTISPSKALIKMQSEIIYLKQEVEFLKKILQEPKW